MVPVSFAFTFCGEEFRLTPDPRGARALFWPRENALLVADLHLEKASFYARTGQMLPPYDSRETLERLAAAIRTTGARRVFTLGDNFHDAGGAQRLEPYALGMLAALTRATEWVWLTGNHDEPGQHRENGDHDAAPDPQALAATCGGTVLEELAIGGMVLRHQARPGETRPELSGHFHPRLQMKVHHRHIRRPCAVVGHDAAGGGRMILPAFGALTGGMDAADPAILAAMQPAHTIEALVPAGKRIARFALWREAA